MDNTESSPNSAHINGYISPLKFHKTSQTVACVGNNGGTYDEWIRDGFFKAVNLIYTQIRQCHDEDIYIYPMFYCARHSAELGLKIAIRNILEIYRLKKCAIPENANESYATHDITQLSDILKLLITVDNRLRAEYPSASIYLADYQDDELSDLFRYATSVDGSPNLASANISSIDVDILYQHCCAITDDYSAYIALSEQLIEEYRQGISALLTFKDIGKEGYYSEQFDSVFKYMQKMDFDRTWAIRKIASNSTSIIKGLKKCGQISLLNLLLNQLNSESI